MTVCAVFLFVQFAARAANEVAGVTAVASKVSNDYVRTRLADGTFKAETYAFGEGGHFGGAMQDDSVDGLKFIDVARVISVPLAEQNYVPDKDPKETKLLIMVYWGLTNADLDTKNSIGYQRLQVANEAYRDAVPNGSWGEGKTPDPNLTEQLNEGLELTALMNRQQDEADQRNAYMLGYDFGGPTGSQFQSGLNGIAQRHFKDDLVAEIEENRYFVVLMAYDFQMMWKQKKHRELWETRFSIRQRRNDFGRDLPTMAHYASRYFGQDSRGLLRTRVPEGRVDIGETKSLGEAEPPAK
jgi:hypothetical protein